MFPNIDRHVQRFGGKSRGFTTYIDSHIPYDFLKMSPDLSD
jgi:hypothetical protein